MGYPIRVMHHPDGVSHRDDGSSHELADGVSHELMHQLMGYPINPASWYMGYPMYWYMGLMGIPMGSLYSPYGLSQGLAQDPRLGTPFQGPNPKQCMGKPLPDGVWDSPK